MAAYVIKSWKASPAPMDDTGTHVKIVERFGVVIGLAALLLSACGVAPTTGAAPSGSGAPATTTAATPSKEVIASAIKKSLDENPKVLEAMRVSSFFGEGWDILRRLGILEKGKRDIGLGRMVEDDVASPKYKDFFREGGHFFFTYATAEFIDVVRFTPPNAYGPATIIEAEYTYRWKPTRLVSDPTFKPLRDYLKDPDAEDQLGKTIIARIELERWSDGWKVTGSD